MYKTYLVCHSVKSVRIDNFFWFKVFSVRIRGNTDQNFPNAEVFSLLAIRQKGESQNGVIRKQIMPNFPKNDHFLPTDAHTYARKFFRMKITHCVKNIHIRNFPCPNFRDSDRIRRFHPPFSMRMCVHVSGGKKCSFFGTFGMLCALVSYYRRVLLWKLKLCITKTKRTKLK